VVRNRRGLLLVELLVALGVAAFIGLCVAQVVSTGARGTARAGEVQLATTQAARMVDEVLSLGYASLAELAARGRAIDLTEDAPIVVDGVRFQAVVRMELVEAGLLKVALELTWRDQTTKLVRLVADPLLPFGGTPARPVL
jgi:type II secretory pathway pseudopilin PulG